jgi:hypothetical protein
LAPSQAADLHQLIFGLPPMSAVEVSFEVEPDRPHRVRVTAEGASLSADEANSLHQGLASDLNAVLVDWESGEPDQAYEHRLWLEQPAHTTFPDSVPFLRRAERLGGRTRLSLRIEPRHADRTFLAELDAALVRSIRYSKLHSQLACLADAVQDDTQAVVAVSLETSVPSTPLLRASASFAAVGSHSTWVAGHREFAVATASLGYLLSSVGGL